MNSHTLEKKDFEEAFGTVLSSHVGEKIKKYAFVYESLLPQERDDTILKILKILDGDLFKAGEHRLGQWERGWGENVSAFKAGLPDADMPKYFGKYDLVRWRQEFIRGISPKFEYNMLAVIQDWLFEQYLKDAPSIYEFGCGTGHNLTRAREANPSAMLYGLDWVSSSQEIIGLIAGREKDTRRKGIKFDIFHPDSSVRLDPRSGIYTVAALEQVGGGFEPFIQYLLENKPKVCIHIEPIGELLDENNILDFLSVQYFRKRNYLSGFMTRLQALEKEGTIVIHRAQRTNIGSFFVDGYSVVVWFPKA